MQAILQVIKTHLISLASGVVAIVCIVVTVMGMSSTKVEDEMQAALREVGASSLRGLQSNPKNEEIIRVAQARAEGFEKEYNKTLAAVRHMNIREPLMAEAFPKPARESTPLKFIEVYKQALRVLPRDLMAGTLPTAAEIAEEQQNVDDLLALEAEQAAESLAEDDDGRKPVAPPGSAPPRGGRFSGGGMQPGGGMMPPGGGMRPGRDERSGMRPGGSRFGGGMQPAGSRFGGGMQPGRSPAAAAAQTGGEPKYDAVYRARVSKAQSIRCYIDDKQATFHVSPIVQETSAPSSEDMWYAQVSLWIQQDVIKAIAALNNRVAAKIEEGDASVEHSPVKRLSVIRVLGYDAEIPIDFPSMYGGPGTDRRSGGGAPESFTQRKANDLYDVVRFQIVVVVDQREMLKLVDEISRANLYQCTGLSYVKVDRVQDQDTEGYFYGTAPVVRATLDFEGYLLRDAYKELMPPKVREALGIKDGDG